MKGVFGEKHGVPVGLLSTQGVCELWPPDSSVYLNSSLFIIWRNLSLKCGGK